jgi:hypothetical protein
MIDESGERPSPAPTRAQPWTGTMPREVLAETGVESPRWYVPSLVVHAKWAGQAQREQPKVTRGRRCVSQKVAVAEVGGCRRTGW